MTLRVPFIRALLIDISGTLLIGSSAIPGTAQAIAKLRTAHIPFRLCSNTSKESNDAVHKRMLEAGLDVRRAEVWTSIGALRAMLKDLRVKRPYMLLSQSAREECTEEPVARAGSSATPEPYDAVVIGLAPPLLDYAHLNTAFRILIGEDRPQDSSQHTPGFNTKPDARPRPPLIALHKGRYLEASDHALSLGPGPFVNALEEATQTSAIVVGKPTRSFFETVLRDLDLDRDLGNPEHVGSSRVYDRERWEGIAVIGDDVQADLGQGAIELGLWRVLVQTGKYRPGDEHRSEAQPPDQVCGSFAEFVEMLLEQRRT